MKSTLYTAIKRILTFAIPHYELSISIKVFRRLLIATAIFAANGFFIGNSLLIFAYLVTTTNENSVFMAVSTIFPTAFSRVLIRFPMSDDALDRLSLGQRIENAHE